MTTHLCPLTLRRLLASFVGFFFLSVCFLLPPAVRAAEGVKQKVDLPADTAEKSLKRLSEQTGAEVLYPTNFTKDVRTNAVTGEYTPREALDRLLDGTGLVAAQDNRTGALTVRRETPAETKNVNRAIAQESGHPESRSRESAIQLEPFTVTGSRIRTIDVNEASFSPLVSVSRLDMERIGITSMGELSRLIPQAYSLNSYDGIGYGGQSPGIATTPDGSQTQAVGLRTTINLRGLGVANTLVLIDGRRIARSGNIGGEDGYDLSGIPASAVERVEVLTDGASAIYGSDALGGVVNIILRKNYTGVELNLGYENTFNSDTAVKTISLTGGIIKGHLSLLTSAVFQTRNAFAARDRSFSATDYWKNLGGTTNPSLFRGVSFIGAGGIQPQSGTLPGLTISTVAIPTNSSGIGLTIEDYASAGAPDALLDRAKYANIISPQATASFSGRLTYDLSPSLTLFSDARWSRTSTEVEGLPVNFGGFISVPAGYPGNPFGKAIYLHKYFWELGNLAGQKDAITEEAAISGGVKGTYGSWRFGTDLNVSRSKVINKNANSPSLDQSVYNTLIANQSLILLYDSRTQQPNSLTTLRSLIKNDSSSDQLTTGVWAISADGPLPVASLPGGPINVAAGFEGQREEVSTYLAVPDDPTINRNLTGSFARSLESAYIETRLPLAKNYGRVFKSVEASVAIRYDNYSDIGGDYSPRVGLLWKPAEWLLLRATDSHAFRAPTLSSLYRPVTFSSTSNSAGFIDPTTKQPVVGRMQTKIGGNLSLKPEHSKSENFGLVLESPLTALKGLTLSVDYLRIKYVDQIVRGFSLQDWADLFPTRLLRDVNGQVIGVDTRETNISKLDVKTIDYQLQYIRKTSLGVVDTKVSATTYQLWEAQSTKFAAPVSALYARPTRLVWQTFLTLSDVSFGISGFYQAKTWADDAHSKLQFDSAIEWNAHFSYELSSRMTRQRSAFSSIFSDIKVSVSVFNVINREPPHAQGQAGFGVTDPRMRRYGITLTKHF